MPGKLKVAEQPVKLRLKKGDEVHVLSGKDRGKTGKIVRAMPKVNKVIVEGVNLITKHQKERPAGPPGSGSARIAGGRIEKPAPMCAAKVMLICPACQKPTRVGYAFKEGEGKLSRRKYRVCKRAECGKSID